MNTPKYTQREGKYILGSFSFLPEAETKNKKNKIIIIMADKNFMNRYSKSLCTIKESFQLQVSYSEHTPGNVVEELGSLLSCIIDGIETVIVEIHRNFDSEKDLYEYQYIYIKQNLYYHFNRASGVHGTRQ